MRKEIRLGILIFFLALTARVLYLEDIKDTFLFHHPIVDSGAYDFYSAELATDAASGGGISGLHRIPLYRSFLVFLYKAGGHNVYLARFAQSTVGSLSCLLIYFLGSLAFDRRVGIISGIVASLYWPLIAFEAKFLPVTFAVFFSLLTILFLCLFQAKKNVFLLFPSGVFLALAVASRSNILLLFPVLFFWLLIRFVPRAGLIKAVSFCAIFMLGFTLILSPFLLRFYDARKEIMPVQDNYGIGIYLGSDLEHINIKPGSQWRKLMMEFPERGLTGIGERNYYFLKKAKDIIVNRPLGFLDNILKKMYILWNRYEFSPRENINYFRKKSGFLSLPLFNFGSVAALSLLGMILAWSRREKAAPLYLFVLTYQVSLLLFMPLSRYRLPIAPFLIVLACFSASQLFEYLRSARWRALGQYAAFFIIVFILTNTNVLGEYLEGFSRPHYHEGLAYYRHAESPVRALGEFRKALRRHPDDADIYEAIGNIYLEAGDLSRAEISYKKALKLEERFPEVMNNLGVVYAKRDESKKAKAIFEKVLSLFPVESVRAHINLGSVFMREDNYEMAEREYKRALFLDPDNLQALYQLASLYEKTGNPEAGRVREKYNNLAAALTQRLTNKSL